MKIKELKAFKIEDSRGNPTIGIIVNNEKSSAPFGKSTGKFETPPYRDSLEWNVRALNYVKFNFEINSVSDLEKVEAHICNKFGLDAPKEFGANGLYALEAAILKALARSQKKELWQVIGPKISHPRIPIPVGNIIGGGMHSHGKNHPTFQEFLIIPKSRSISENCKIMKEMHKKLKKHLKSGRLNDEGAIETSLDEESILSLLSHFSGDIRIGLDIAASSFYRSGSYFYNKKALSREEQIGYVNSLIKRFNLFYIEDPLAEEDFSGFSGIFRDAGHLVVGDDLTATQIPRLKKAIANHSINALIIKPNQNGSILEILAIAELCRKNKIKMAVSHRSGETLDTFISDLAVGIQADLIKAGIETKWREAKLRRLIEIESSFAK